MAEQFASVDLARTMAVSIIGMNGAGWSRDQIAQYAENHPRVCMMPGYQFTAQVDEIRRSIIVRSRVITREQRESLHNVWIRNNCGLTYRAFRRSAYIDAGGTLIIPNWCGMFVGIEPDGYTHT